MTRPNDSDTLVSVEALYRYYGEYCAVHDLDLELRKGEVLGLLGPNGAGKSTTMSVLSGNLAPSSGRVRIDGVDILDEPAAAKSALGYLPELPPVYTDLTVDEYLDYAAGLHRVPRARRRAAREDAKERCGLADTGRRLIGNLSKGYQQRVGIAQAIVHNPKVVILDEPTIGLDPIQIRGIRDLIADLGREHSVILSTHILPEVQAACSRVAIIHEGRLVFEADMRELDEQLRETGFMLVLEHDGDPGALREIAGVTGIEVQDPRHIRVLHAPGASPAAAVARIAAERGWGVLELVPERKTLEQVFVDLTSTDREPEAA